MSSTIESTTVRVPNMHCEGCRDRVADALEDLVGVQEVGVDLDEKTVDVDYRMGKTDISDMAEIVERMGYTFEM